MTEFNLKPCRLVEQNYTAERTIENVRLNAHQNGNFHSRSDRSDQHF